MGCICLDLCLLQRVAPLMGPLERNGGILSRRSCYCCIIRDGGPRNSGNLSTRSCCYFSSRDGGPRNSGNLSRRSCYCCSTRDGGARTSGILSRRSCYGCSIRDGGHRNSSSLSRSSYCCSTRAGGSRNSSILSRRSCYCCNTRDGGLTNSGNLSKRSCYSCSTRDGGGVVCGRKSSGLFGAVLRIPRRPWMHRTGADGDECLVVATRAEKEGKDFGEEMLSGEPEILSGEPELLSEEPEIPPPPAPPSTVRSFGMLSGSPDFWWQVTIFGFAAGLVDAGFSGDWSRIGVLSKETEVDLQLAAIGIVPLAATLIWSISQRRKKN